MGKKARDRVSAARAPFDLERCCAEAQADGVPCTELGRECETCERALERAGSAQDEAREGDAASPG